MNTFAASQAGQITEITASEKGESNVVILNASGIKTSQVIPAGLILTIKTGDIVQNEQALNLDPNVGGFGQEESEIVLQNPIRIVGQVTSLQDIAVREEMTQSDDFTVTVKPLKNLFVKGMLASPELH
jgi:hypothetical protein